MITLGQIHLLEKKIEEVLKRLQSLEEENKILLDKNNALKKEKENLAYRISTFEADQEQIEKGILNALDKLNTIESAVIKESISHTVKSQNVEASTANQIVDQVQTPVERELQSSKAEVKNDETISEPSTEIDDDFSLEIEEEIEIPSSKDDSTEFDIF
jgi:regulator of replication initiation timing